LGLVTTRGCVARAPSGMPAPAVRRCHPPCVGPDHRDRWPAAAGDRPNLARPAVPRSPCSRVRSLPWPPRPQNPPRPASRLVPACFSLRAIDSRSTNRRPWSSMKRYSSLGSAGNRWISSTTTVAPRGSVRNPLAKTPDRAGATDRALRLLTFEKCVQPNFPCKPEAQAREPGAENPFSLACASGFYESIVQFPIRDRLVGPWAAPPSPMCFFPPRASRRERSSAPSGAWRMRSYRHSFTMPSFILEK
jgi:hypothetical protein